MKLAPRILCAVAFGGAVGSLLRWLVELLLPVSEGSVPWGTLTVNVAGSALLGVVVVTMDTGLRSSVHREFLATGVLGGFTTFSTYAVQVAVLGDSAPMVALAYLFATPVLCIVGAVLAAALVRLVWRLP